MPRAPPLLLPPRAATPAANAAEAESSGAGPSGLPPPPPMSITSSEDFRPSMRSNYVTAARGHGGRSDQQWAPIFLSLPVTRATPDDRVVRVIKSCPSVVEIWKVTLATEV